MTELKRTLKLPEVIFFASGVILGAGIYTVIGKAAGLGGNMLWLAFLISSLTALLTIFAYAELSSAYPKAGGEFFYVKEVLGQTPAYITGTVVALGGIIAAATIAIGFAGYFAQLLEVNKLITGLCITGLILLINILGIRQSSVFNIIFTIVETGGLIFVIASASAKLGDVSYVELPPAGIHGILAAAALCFFAFTGFEDTVKLAEETKKPEKTIPKALFISSSIIILLYLCITVTAVSAVPFEELGQSESPLSTIMERSFGRTGAIILAVVALFSTSNSLLSNMLGASRVIYTMGKESRKLRLLSRVSSKRQTPVPALILAACCSAAFVVIGDVKTVALTANFFVFGTFLTINYTVIRLRLKNKKSTSAFRIPFNIRNIPVLSILAIFMILVLVGYTLYALSMGESA